MIVWWILLIVPLPGLYDYCPKFRCWVKFSVYYVWLMLASLVMIPLSLARPGSVDNARIGAKLMKPMNSLLGISWSLRGNVELLSLTQPYVIVANHQSSVDILGMFHIWEMVGRMTVIAKQSLMYYGTFGITAYLCGTVFIDRTNIKEAANKINSVAQTLIPGQVKLWVFPEGTRNSDKKVCLLPFKKGAFHVAHSCNLPILPIGKNIRFSYLRKMLIQFEHLVINKHSFLDENTNMFETGEGVITVLPMIQPEGKSVQELLENTRQVMMNQLLL